MQETGRKIVTVANVVWIITMLAGIVGAIIGIANLDWDFEESLTLLISSIVLILIGYVNSLLIKGFGVIVEGIIVMTGVSLSEGNTRDTLNRFIKPIPEEKTEKTNVEEVLEDL